MIAKDKQLHALAGAIIALVFTPLIGWWAIIPVAVIGWGKEVWDATGNGTCDIFDFVWTCAGGLVVLVILA